LCRDEIYRDGESAIASRSAVLLLHSFTVKSVVKLFNNVKLLISTCEERNKRKDKKDESRSSTSISKQAVATRIQLL
jgi:hypothetical protein